MILRDHSHSLTDDTGVCATCGQPVPAEHHCAPGYGERRVNPGGLAVTVLLHLLLLAVFLLRPQAVKKPAPPASVSITYINAVPPKPKAAAKAKPTPVKSKAPERIEMARLPNTITLPRQQPVTPVPPVEPEPPKVIPKLDPAEDMAARIEARRRERGQSDQPAEESEAERGNRIARANIASANGAKGGTGQTESMFEVTGTSFAMRDVKFDTEFMKSGRHRLRQVRVELETETDIETAVVKKMIEIIRTQTTSYFTWTNDKGTDRERKLILSARPEDTAELTAFLMKQYFPAYRPPRRQ